MSAKILSLENYKSGSHKPRVRGLDMTGIEIRNDRIRITFNWQGQRCRETLNFPFTDSNLKVAVKLRVKILAEIDAGTFRYGDHFPQSARAQRLGITPAKSTLFGEYAERWVKSKDDINSSAKKDYQSATNRFWKPTLGHLRADQITKSIVDEAISSFEWASAKHRNDSLIPLRGVLRTMFQDQAISIDISALIKNKKRQKPEPDPLTLSEVDQVLNHIEKTYGSEMRNIFETAIFTGVRPGELIALHWEDFDPEMRVLSISRSWGHDQEDEDVEDSTKSFRVRHIELNSRAMAALERQRQITGSGEVVFLSRKNNQPYASSNHLHNRVWKPTLQALNIRARRMYQTRHTFATLNIMAGANPYWIAKQMGHVNAQLVFTTYGKWIDGAEKVRQPGLLDDWLATGNAPSVPQATEGK